jgi:hypothetical protein
MAAIPVLFITILVVIWLFASRCHTLYSVAGNGHEFRVVYCPGGGAIGPPHHLEVRVTNDKWLDELLANAIAVDSAEIVFIDSSIVKITLIDTGYVTIPGKIYWELRRRDSATFNLADQEITTWYFGHD